MRTLKIEKRKGNINMNEENKEVYENLVSERQSASLKKVARKVADEQMKAFQEGETLKVKISTLKERMRFDKVNDVYTNEKNKLDAKENIKKKASSCMSLAVLGSVISFFMTIAGLTGAKTLQQIIEACKGEYLWVSMAFALAQGSGIWLAFNTYSMKEYHNSNYSIMNAWRLTVSAMSVYYNHQFIISYDTGMNEVALWVASATPDIVSNIFGNASIQIKFGLYSMRGKTHGWLSRFINIITFIPRLLLWKLGDKVDEVMSDFYVKSTNGKSEVNLSTMGFTDDKTEEEKNEELKEIILKVLDELEEKNITVGSTIFPSRFSFTDWEWSRVRDELAKRGMFEKKNKLTKLAKPIEEIRKELTA